MGIESASNRYPEKLKLLQNYPNPFNPITTIRYQLPEPAEVNLTIFDPLGQKVRTLVNEHQSAGEWSIVWDGRDDQIRMINSGVYLYRIRPLQTFTNCLLITPSSQSIL